MRRGQSFRRWSKKKSPPALRTTDSPFFFLFSKFSAPFFCQDLGSEVEIQPKKWPPTFSHVRLSAALSLRPSASGGRGKRGREAGDADGERERERGGQVLTRRRCPGAPGGLPRQPCPGTTLLLPYRQRERKIGPCWVSRGRILHDDSFGNRDFGINSGKLPMALSFGIFFGFFQCFYNINN